MVGSARALAIGLLLVPRLAAAEKNGRCTGEYADDMAQLAPRARAFEQQPQAQYSYAVRNTATYECLSYGPDGSVRRARKKAILHGTGFGYRRSGNETLLITNNHIAEWPPVTDDDHTVDGVPAGCKKVGEVLKIVDNESDAYEADDVALTKVVSDPQLDVAILRAHAVLPTLPWKIGRSAALRTRNVVEVRGFPLGAFQATNVGKVVSAYDHDDYREWDHDDFVVDALLSPGNSGSPVLAVSCKTGEFELVGIYHAGYARGSALNVVVGIDQVRQMMQSLKRTPKPKTDEVGALGGRERSRLVEAARGQTEPFFPFGNLAAVARPRSDGAIVFEVFSREFPTKSQPILVLEDLPPLGATGGFGEVGRVWFGGAQGLKAWNRADLDADAQAQVARLTEALRRDALAAFAYRMAAHDAHSSRERFEKAATLERALSHNAALRRDLSSQLGDLAERLSPHGKDMAAALADAFAPAAVTPAAAPAAAQAAPGKREVGKR